MTTILSIDPGASTGWAIIRSVGGGCIGVLDSGQCPVRSVGPTIRAMSVARHIDVGVCEVPRIYPGRGKADPGDIVTLALRLGIVVGSIDTVKLWRGVHPMTWKGQLPKDVCHARLRSRFRSLGSVPASQTDRLDAIALGVWYLDLGQAAEGMTFPVR